MSVDQKCLDLAISFLADYPGKQHLALHLAERIQAAIEDFLDTVPPSKTE